MRAGRRKRREGGGWGDDKERLQERGRLSLPLSSLACQLRNARSSPPPRAGSASCCRARLVFLDFLRLSFFLLRRRPPFIPHVQLLYRLEVGQGVRQGQRRRLPVDPRGEECVSSSFPIPFLPSRSFPFPRPLPSSSLSYARRLHLRPSPVLYTNLTTDLKSCAGLSPPLERFNVSSVCYGDSPTGSHASLLTYSKRFRRVIDSQESTLATHRNSRLRSSPERPGTGSSGTTAPTLCRRSTKLPVSMSLCRSLRAPLGVQLVEGASSSSSSSLFVALQTNTLTLAAGRVSAPTPTSLPSPFVLRLRPSRRTTFTGTSRCVSCSFPPLSLAPTSSSPRLQHFYGNEQVRHLSFPFYRKSVC
jgi:hypothetical protein